MDPIWQDHKAKEGTRYVLLPVEDRSDGCEFISRQYGERVVRI